MPPIGVAWLPPGRRPSASPQSAELLSGVLQLCQGRLPPTRGGVFYELRTVYGDPMSHEEDPAMSMSRLIRPHGHSIPQWLGKRLLRYTTHEEYQNKFNEWNSNQSTIILWSSKWIHLKDFNDRCSFHSEASDDRRQTDLGASKGWCQPAELFPWELPSLDPTEWTKKWTSHWQVLQVHKQEQRLHIYATTNSIFHRRCRANWLQSARWSAHNGKAERTTKGRRKDDRFLGQYSRSDAQRPWLDQVGWGWSLETSNPQEEQ